MQLVLIKSDSMLAKAFLITDFGWSLNFYCMP